MTDSQVFGMVFIAMALVAFVALVFFRRRAILLYKHGVTTEAVVLDVKKLKGEAGTSYRTEVRFTDIDGGEIHGRMSLTHRYGADDRISVVYDPANPKRVDLTSAIRPRNPDAGPLALGKLGWAVVLVLAIPGVVLVVGRWGDPI